MRSKQAAPIAPVQEALEREGYVGPPDTPLALIFVRVVQAVAQLETELHGTQTPETAEKAVPHSTTKVSSTFTAHLAVPTLLRPPLVTLGARLEAITTVVMVVTVVIEALHEGSAQMQGLEDTAPQASTHANTNKRAIPHGWVANAGRNFVALSARPRGWKVPYPSVDLSTGRGASLAEEVSNHALTSTPTAPSRRVLAPIALQRATDRTTRSVQAESAYAFSGHKAHRVGSTGVDLEVLAYGPFPRLERKEEVEVAKSVGLLAEIIIAAIDPQNEDYEMLLV